jgi:hypothetical protein
MHIDLFLSNLALTLAVVTVAMWYLRHTTRSVIRELCHTDAAAEFWLRSTDVLAYSGALMLVLMFGEFSNDNFVASIRITLIFTLLGLFLTVLFASRNVWNRANPQVGAVASATKAYEPWHTPQETK